MFERGKEYYFHYPNVKMEKEYEINLIVIVPIDYNYFDGDAPWIIKYRPQNSNLKDYYFIKYFDKIPLRGKNKWVLYDTKKTTITAKDLPDSVDCSLNTFEHPSKRKWFKHKNFGLNVGERKEMKWEDWSSYYLMMEDNDITLLYRIICSLVSIEYPLERDYLILKKIVGDYFLSNYPYKMNNDLLDEYHENYLRDIMNIW